MDLAAIIISGVDAFLVSEVLSDPERAQQHAHSIVTAIGQLLPMFGQ
jgi:hypothetical protein